MSNALYIKASCVISSETVYTNDVAVYGLPGAALPDFLQGAYQFFGCNYPKFHKMDNLGKLGWLAAELLLAGSFDKSAYRPEDTGLVFCNKSGSLDTDIKYYDTVKTIASPALFVYTLPNIVMGEICIRHNFKGENDFFIFEYFNPGFIHQYVSHLFETGVLEACVCGWVEIIDNDYKACLYLTEKKATDKTMLFTEENIHHIYQTTHG